MLTCPHAGVGKLCASNSIKSHWLRLAQCGTVRRFKEIMISAPWSNHDLLSALIVFFIGLHLLVDQDLFGWDTYLTMSQMASQFEWGVFFLGCGVYSLISTLWCQPPPFLVRLTGRMSSTFCFLILMFNNLSHSPMLVSTMTYTVLSLWSLWGILRTTNRGG